MHLKIYLGNSIRLRGIRGLFAGEKIKKGEIIEACPIILIPHEQMAEIEKTVLTKYEFTWDENNEALALGYGSLFNHDKDANVEFDRDFEKRQIIFSAKRDIEPDEELYIDYHQGDTEDEEELPKEYIDFLH